MVEDNQLTTNAQTRAEIARVRREISKAARVFLLLPNEYHRRTHGEYVRVSKADARRIVGLMPEESRPFQLQWDGMDLYIPPPYSDEG